MRNQPARHRGFSLVEVMVASGLFGLVMAIAYNCYEIAWKSYNQGENRTHVFRLANIAMNGMVNEARNCTHIYAPDQTTLQAGFHPTGSPIIFACGGLDGPPTVVAYRVGADHSLQRYLYGPDFAPDQPASWTVPPDSTRVLNRSFQDTVFVYSVDTLHNEFLQVSVQTTRNDWMQTTAHIVGGFPSNSTSSSNGAVQ